MMKAPKLAHTRPDSNQLMSNDKGEGANVP